VSPGNELELAIGTQIRALRRERGLTVVQLARESGLSPGMISKVERGVTPPSLATLRSVATAMNVPVTALFRRYEEQRDASFVAAGEGLRIDRRGTRVGHRYELLGHTVGGSVSVEPYLISLTEESEIFPHFQHPGVELIYMLAGEVSYRAAGATYRLRAGDSLLFDADAAHGPEDLVQLPCRFLSVICTPPPR
jgi:transcriptional regulator with XRE-family HTH domain